MPGINQKKLPHLLITGTSSTKPYTSPASGGKSFTVPKRHRETHGRQLLQQFETIREQADKVIKEQKAYGIDAKNGIYIQFESDPGFALKAESLEIWKSGIELLSEIKDGNRTLATVFVPEGKLDILVNKFSAYLDPEKDTPKGRPRNEALVAGIASIKKAALDALWTDTPETLPADDEVIWWEVWLRTKDDPLGETAFFREHARHMGLTVLDEELRFPDRTVIAVQGSKEQISRSVNLLNCIAELRRLKEEANFFSSMDRFDQLDWLNAALDQITPPEANSPAICILDTGINQTHPLLKPVLAPEYMDTCDPAWGTSDHHGHGTEMAGLAAYGDLTDLLADNTPTVLAHQLESVKILPPNGSNEPHLYGQITAEAVARAEIFAPDRKRNFCMAVTATDFRDAGQPSSWSAGIDSLCSGAFDETRRLIIVSAGNTEREERHNFPHNNLTEGIHDPGQAWNALTVGAYTEKNHIDPAQYPDWRTVAPPGDLSPSSTTSMDWSRTWPIKPDIVMEGGNMGLHPTAGTADSIDSLELLSTNWQHELMRPLVITGETSAATALAARFAAIIQAQYPEYWPETIRAMLIHSAEWTEAMKKRFAPFRVKQDRENLLRYCGYGVPDLSRALWSANNALTLVAQDTLQPFDKKEGKIVTRDMHLHAIPWPTELLAELDNTPVTMRVTLSYFIEPNPARRGWGKKYSYASHGLRFEVKRPLESLENFQKRINKAARDEETGRSGASSPTDPNWILGKNLRKIGSVHSDAWFGPAVELAQRGHIAVFPVMGWWKSNPRHERWANKARYSLIVTIKTPETEVDLYTPVATKVTVPVNIAIET